MSILDRKLSAMPVGVPVRFTQANGQIIEGVISENDGSEALSVQISTIVTLKYSQITGIEESNAFGKSNFIPQPIPQSAPVPDHEIEITVSCTEDDIRTAFNAMDKDVRKTFTSVWNKIQSAMKSHDYSKITEAVDSCWDIMETEGFEENPKVNAFYARICLLDKYFEEASKSFYYADDIINAYRSAYVGAETEDRTKLSSLAGAFASIYIAEGNGEYLDEAMEVLKISSEKCRDITGLEYIISNNINDTVKTALSGLFKYLGGKCGHAVTDFSNFKVCISAMKPFYNSVTMNNFIEEYKNISAPVPATASSTAPVPVPVKNEWYKGKITVYKFFEENGRIEGSDGTTYMYELNDVTDISLKNQLKKMTSRNVEPPIEVEYKLTRKMGKDYASGIKRGSRPVPVPAPVRLDANSLYTRGRHSEAIELFRNQLETPKWEEAFSQMIMSYIALWNKNGDMGYSEEIEKLVEKYSGQLTLSKSFEVLHQYYMKVQNYSKALSALNELIELCGSSDHKHILNCLLNKSRCYRRLHDYPSAIGQLQDWLEIVKKNRITERYDMRRSIIYIELAELYFEIEDYEQSEKYALESAGSEERKQALLKKLEAVGKSEEPEDEYSEDDDEDSADDSTSMTLQEAYDAYIDEDGFEKLGITDADVAEKITAFDKKNLYCLITWLSAVSVIAKKNRIINDSVLNSEMTMSQAIQGIESAFSYAYHNPLVECEYTSTNVKGIYEISRKLIPQYNDGLMVSAVLRTLFDPSDMQDYYFENLVSMVEESGLSEQYPMLVNLVNAMKSFYESTGCAIDAFAGYRSNDNVIDDVVAEAVELCSAMDNRNGIFESQGQVRRLREAMFSDEQSELRKCLNIVAENKTEDFKYVHSCMERLFIRNGRPLTSDNIDNMKLDDYIDSYWDKARDIIVSEKRHIARPHDKIKGSKRNNVVVSAKKIISCICDWLAVAEHSGNNEEAYIKQNYENVAPHITSMLEELYSASSLTIAENGFDWGIDSICTTADELLSKMKGTYNAKTRKYFFIDFLSSEEVLLNEDYLPELQSTFCGWGRMNILNRIERHATGSHITFEERISGILSDDTTKHDFRTARLIRAYAEDVKDTALSGHKDFEMMNACQKQAKRRFDSMYQDFSSQMEVFESNGVISNQNGEKTSILRLALDWYRISRITNDFGFYARILDYIKNYISLNAVERGQELMRQLEELADKPEYDFGVYPKEMIVSLINDQNYTTVEFILNCIRRHDTKYVHDYCKQPFDYFQGFANEYATNYRAVFGAGRNIVDTISAYSGKKDLEKALDYLTGNARKETSGGAKLLKNWIPKGGPAKPEDLQKLLTRLGFNPVSIVPEENNVNIESYKVFCQKRKGKVTYPHCIPAFGSLTETEGFRVACLYGKFDCNGLMNSFRMMNTTAKHTLVLLDYAMNMEERRRLARKIKEEKSFSKTFIVVDRVVLFYLAKHYSVDTISNRLMAVTLPFAYYQPFVEASNQTMPAELFTGREAELTSIESPEGVNLVYGGRQLGKSALLKMAQHNVDRNGNNDRAVFMDIKDRNYKEVAKLLSQELITDGILDESCECDNWDDLARHIKKRLMDENPETRINYLLIMLDEADKFIETSTADDNPPITAVKNLPAGRFKLVMAGLHNLSRFNREMLQGNSNLIHLSSIVIKQFQRPEAIKLLTNTLAYLGFRFDEKVVTLILAKTNYYPGLIQFYCQKLLEAMKNDDYAGYSEISTPYYEVNEGHIKKVLSDSDFMAKVNEKLEASLFTEEKGRSHYHIIALIFAYLYEEVSNEKKYTVDDLMRVAQEYKITRLLKLNKEKIEELLNEMWDLNILSKEDEYYRFATEGFRELLGSREQVEDGISQYIEEENQ